MNSAYFVLLLLGVCNGMWLECTFFSNCETTEEEKIISETSEPYSSTTPNYTPEKTSPPIIVDSTITDSTIKPSFSTIDDNNSINIDTVQSTVNNNNDLTRSTTVNVNQESSVIEGKISNNLDTSEIKVFPGTSELTSSPSIDISTPVRNSTPENPSSPETIANINSESTSNPASESSTIARTGTPENSISPETTNINSELTSSPSIENSTPVRSSTPESSSSPETTNINSELTSNPSLGSSTPENTISPETTNINSELTSSPSNENSTPVRSSTPEDPSSPETTNINSELTSSPSIGSSTPENSISLETTKMTSPEVISTISRTNTPDSSTPRNTLSPSLCQREGRFASTVNCKNYILCVQVSERGQYLAILKTCPFHLYFDQNLKICRFDVNCGERSK